MPSTTSQTVAFVLLSALTIGSAVMVVTLRNLIHAALMLGVSFVGVAGLYLLLHAEFIAAAQVLVYVGAITVLILFAIMLTQGITGGAFLGRVHSQPLLGAGVAAAMFLLMGQMLMNQRWPGAVDAAPVDNATRVLGVQLLTTYIVPFEVSSVLLLVALVASIVLARDEEIVSVDQHTNEIYDDTDPRRATVPSGKSAAGTPTATPVTATRPEDAA